MDEAKYFFFDFKKFFFFFCIKCAAPSGAEGNLLGVASLHISVMSSKFLP